MMVFIFLPFDPFTPRVSSGDINLILTSESVAEILWRDHSNETSSAVFSHGTIHLSILQNEIWVYREFWF